jgi:hypothetical protein
MFVREQTICSSDLVELHPATLALAKTITARLPSSEEFLETALLDIRGDAQHPLARTR